MKEQRILWKVFDNNLRKPRSIVICQQFFSPPVRSDRYAKIFPLRKLRITQAYYTLHSREVHLFAKSERGMKYSQIFHYPMTRGYKGASALHSLACEQAYCFRSRANVTRNLMHLMRILRITRSRLLKNLTILFYGFKKF